MVNKDGMRVETFVMLLFLHVLMTVFLLIFTKLGLASLILVLFSATVSILGISSRSNKESKIDELRETLVKVEDENVLWEKFHKVKNWESDYQRLTSTSKKSHIDNDNESDLLLKSFLLNNQRGLGMYDKSGRKVI